jgi:hypothetical protein
MSAKPLPRQKAIYQTQTVIGCIKITIYNNKKEGNSLPTFFITASLWLP